MCFFLSLLLAKRRSQPSNSHWKGFSPVDTNTRAGCWRARRPPPPPAPRGTLPPTPPLGLKVTRPPGGEKRGDRAWGFFAPSHLTAALLFPILLFFQADSRLLTSLIKLG